MDLRQGEAVSLSRRGLLMGATTVQSDSMAKATRQECLKNLLLDALDREPKEREAFVRTTVADAAMRQEVLELIESHEQAGQFMNDPSGLSEAAGARAAASLEGPGSIIDRYQLKE